MRHALADRTHAGMGDRTACGIRLDEPGGNGIVTAAPAEGHFDCPACLAALRSAPVIQPMVLDLASVDESVARFRSTTDFKVRMRRDVWERIGAPISINVTVEAVPRP